MDYRFSIDSSLSVNDVSYLSVREVSVDLWLSSSASFLNYLNPRGDLGKCGGRL